MSKALIGVTVLSLLWIPLAAVAAEADGTAAAKLADTEAAILSLERQLAPSSSTFSVAISTLSQRCTTSTTCNQTIVCLLPDGTEGALGVTKRTCCPICQSFPCEIQACTTEVIGVFCGCG